MHKLAKRIGIEMSRKTNLNILLTMCVFLLGIGPTTFAGQIYHVDSVIGDDDNDGLTHKTAFATIQKGIDTAIDGDTVIVWPGQYLDPWTEDNIDFLGKNIILTSIDPNDLSTVSNTIIGGTVLFSGTEDPNCTLTGFTIRSLGFGAIYGNDTQATISYCVVSGNGPCRATVIENYDGTSSNFAQLWRKAKFDPPAIHHIM